MYEFNTHVGPSQCGRDAKQTMVSVVSMMQDCSQMWELSEPEFVKWLTENNLTMVVASRQVDVIRRPALYEKLTVRTSIYDFSGYLGYRNTFIYDEAGEPVAKCWAIGAFISLETGKMARIPQENLDVLCIEPKLDMEYLSKKIKMPDVEPVALEPMEAFHSDIDFNQHVNNVKYVVKSLDCLPADFVPMRMRIEHKAQCREGARLYPIIRKVNDQLYYVTLANEEGKPYTNIEFAG